MICAVHMASLRYVHQQTLLRAPTIRLRAGACERLREILECDTDYEVADVIGMDPTQLSRIRRGKSDVGPNFLARVMLALAAKGVSTAELFEVMDVHGNTTPMSASCDMTGRRTSAFAQRRAS